MSNRAFNVANLSEAQIEERLKRAGVSDEERAALVEELSKRVAGDLLKGRGIPSPEDPATGARRFEPPPVGATTPPSSPQAPKPSQRPPNPQAPTRRAPAGAAPAVRQPNQPAAAPRRGCSRSLASLLALLLVAGGAWVITTLINLPEPDPDNIGPSGGIAPSGVDPVDPEPVDPEPVDPEPVDPEPGDEAVSGPAGTVQVDWVLDGVTYRARLMTNGRTGAANVTYESPVTGEEVTVRQDLRFERTDDVWHYTGANPRDPATGVGIDDYSPDVFLLERNDDGSWYFTQVCDTAGSCSEADMTTL